MLRTKQGHKHRCFPGPSTQLRYSQEGREMVAYVGPIIKLTQFGLKNSSPRM